jgi:glycosyl transferase family 25
MQHPPVIVINLDHRADRWAETIAAFPGMPLERFSSIKEPSGVDGCRKSHLAVVRVAKERNYPWVAIMEDDCMPYPHFQHEYNSILPLLWKHKSEWDIFNSGPINLKSMYRLEHNLVRVDTSTCIQFYIVNSTAYDGILEHVYGVDHSEVDHYYEEKFIHGVVPHANASRVVTCAPPLTYQRNSKSDIQIYYNIGETNEFNIAYKKIMMFCR